MNYNGTTIAQNITNKAHAKKDFTTYLTKSKSRYIVSIKNIFTGKNFANCYDMILRVSKIVNSGYYDSIGGWNFESNYFVDANLHFQDLDLAMQCAKNNKQIAIFDTKENKTIYINN
jgi:hypothetical protein